MTAAKLGPRARRAKGSGEKPRWNAERQCFELRVTLADGSRRWIRETTEHAAEKARGKLLDDIEDGLPTPSERLTVEQWLHEWLAWFKVKTLDPNPTRKRQSYRDYESLVRVHLCPGLGPESLVKLSADRLQRFLTAKRASGCSPRIIGKIRACLRAALSEAARRDLVKHNVAKLVAVDDPGISRVGEALSPAQSNELLRVSAAGRSGPLLALLVTTGLRLGEAQALRWRDVDLPSGRLHVRHTLEKLPGEPWRLVEPKAKSSRRTVPLVPRAIEALQLQKDRQEFERRRAREAWIEYDFVFANEVGDYTAARGVEDAYKVALARAGIDTTHRVHDLRHTTATYLHEQGVDMVTLMAIMGHSTLAMTQRYAHVRLEYLDAAAVKLARAFEVAQ